MDIDEAAEQRAFGSRVREHRQAAGFSQEELGLRSGLDRSFVGQVERGERNLSLINIIRLARALGIATAILFDDKPKRGKP